MSIRIRLTVAALLALAVCGIARAQTGTLAEAQMLIDNAVARVEMDLIDRTVFLYAEADEDLEYLHDRVFSRSSFGPMQIIKAAKRTLKNRRKDSENEFKRLVKDESKATFDAIKALDLDKPDEKAMKKALKQEMKAVSKDAKETFKTLKNDTAAMIRDETLIALSVRQVSSANPELEPKTTLDQHLAEFIDSDFAASGSPGRSIAVVRNGEIIYCEGQGHLAKGVLAECESVYALGSLTKQFTAAAMLSLDADPDVDLDIDAAIPPGFWGGSPASIRDLLSHRALILDYLSTRPYRLSNRALTVNTHALQDSVEGFRCTYLPSCLFMGRAVAPVSYYSNTHYLIAGNIIETASGESYGAHLDRTMFMPLDLQTLGVYEPSDWVLSGGAHSIGHTSGLPVGREHPSWAAGAGGLSGSASDLAAWLIHLRSEASQPNSAWAEMFLQHGFMHRIIGSTLVSDGSTYALGWFVDQNDDGESIFFHHGSIFGFSSFASIYAHEGDEIIVVILANNQDTSARQSLALPQRMRNLADRIDRLVRAY